VRAESITIHGIHPFAHASVDFSKLPDGGVIAVVGKNGAGKSTFVELIAAGAYRETATHGQLKGLAKDRDAYLRTVLHNGKRWDITHSIDARTGKSEALVLDESGNPAFATTKCTAFDEWAPRHFLPPSVFYAGPFAAQEAEGLCKMKPGDRMAVILRAIGCEHYEAKAKQCRERADKAQHDLETCVARIKDETARGGDIEVAKSDVGRAGAAVSAAESDLMDARLALVTVDEILTSAREQSARVTAEVASQESLIQSHEHDAAEANARRQNALVRHEASKAEMGGRLKDARARVDKTQSAIANNRRVLEDRRNWKPRRLAP